MATRRGDGRSALQWTARGGLLIADDTGNSVWRVSAASP
jgi:hypothetical protein